ncbi:hypothetical protein [Halorussus salinisoli]|nr:hypothetical protein [Halorussus salinisoli]
MNTTSRRIDDLQLQAQVAEMNGWMNVSELIQSINYWNTNDLTT